MHDVAVGDERCDYAAGEVLDCVDELVLHGVLEGAAVVFDDGSSLELDHRLLDLGVDAAEHAGEEVVAEHLCLGAHRGSVVVALVEHDHCFGHGEKQFIAAQGTADGRHGWPSLSSSSRVRARGEGRRTQRAINTHSSATVSYTHLRAHE